MSINTRNNRVPRLSQEFETQLERQLRFIRKSCLAFDNGDHDEAIRIALAIRVLVHNTKSSTSILSHLEIQRTLLYVDTGVYRSLLVPAIQEWVDATGPGCQVVSKSAADVGLVELGYAGKGRVGWFAPLRLRRFADGSPPAKAQRRISPFDLWWTEPLVESSSGKSFSRSDLVLIMANQDGGGHVDADVDKDYLDLIVDPLMQAQITHTEPCERDKENIQDVLYNVAFSSVRQIAFELILTIDRLRYLRSNPGIFVLSNPFGEMISSPPPHRPLNLVTPVAVTYSR
jgi:hypothetical protein